MAGASPTDLHYLRPGVIVYLFLKTPRWAANPVALCPLSPIVNEMG